MKSLLTCGLMVVVAAGSFFLIQVVAESRTSAQATRKSAAGATEDASLRQVLIALVAIIVTGRILAKVFAYLQQPPVIGEVVAGILLGPTLLGEDISGMILPAAVAPYLRTIAQLGVILYMFLVGLELNPSLLRARAHAALAISTSSIALPFVLGAVVALVLFPTLAPPDVTFTSFALFLSVAMSITAFPVLARILTDLGLARTELGMTALTAAAIDDVAAWCLLALAVGVAQAEVQGALLVPILAFVFVAIAVLAVRPVARRLTEKAEARSIAGLLAAALLAAAITEAIGIHAIFGAFLLGVVIPHDSRAARHVHDKLHDGVTALLLPAFFAYTGMRTQIRLVSTVEEWCLCGLILLVATIGKFGGAVLAARWTGVNRRQAMALGVLMNTRGLMELIVLNVGLDLGIISPPLFAMMVLMALVTTLCTSPLVARLISRANVGSSQSSSSQSSDEPEYPK